MKELSNELKKEKNQKTSLVYVRVFILTLL